MNTTDRVFTSMIDEGLRGEFTRHIAAPVLAVLAARFGPSRHAIFSVISQVHIHYPNSPLSEGNAGYVHGGDRLPWTGPDEQVNFDPLRSLNWQVHVYGSTNPGFEAACLILNLASHTIAWSNGAKKVGLKQDAAYLIRPDGYIALASSDQNTTVLTSFLQRFHLHFD